MKQQNDEAMSKVEVLAVLLTVQQVAEMLHVSTRSVWRMHDSGNMPKAVKPGGSSVRWRRSDIEMWIAMDCCTRSEFEARKAVAS